MKQKSKKIKTKCKAIWVQIALFVICTFSLQAQNSPKTVRTFAELVTYFSDRQNILFTYSDNNVRDVSLSFDTSDITLSDFLSAIRDQTLLSVKKIGDGNYIFYPGNKPVTICGKVVDGFTGQPLEAIRVSDTHTATTTNKNGEFSIDTQIYSYIILQGPRYNIKTKKVIELHSEGCTALRLYEETEALDEVTIVSDYLTHGMEKKGDGSIEISPKDLRILPGLVEPDILQSSQLLPGVTSTSEGASDLSIRGGSPDQNLILWDGIKIYNSGHFFDQISAFNPYITESARIYRGGTSVRYGDRISGVIDIHSISKVPKTISVGVGANSTTIDANVQLPILNQKIALIVAGRKSENRLYDTKFTNIENRVFQNTKLDPTIGNKEDFTNLDNTFEFYDTNAKLIWNVTPKDKIQLSGIAMNNTLNFESELLDVETIDTVQTTNYGGSFSWDKTYNSRVSHSLVGGYTNYFYKFSRNELNAIFDEQSISGQKNSVEDLSATYAMSFKLGDQVKLESGYQYTYNRVQLKENNDASSFFGLQNFDITDKLNTHNVFSEIVFDNTIVKVQTGLRANYFREIDEFFLEPRLFASFKVSKKLWINFSSEIKSQVLRQSYQTSNTQLASVQNSWIISNRNPINTSSIPLLTSSQLTSGLTYKNKGFTFDMEYYLKKSGGLVTENENNSSTINDNIYFEGESTTMGIDLLVKKRFGKYKTWLSYSLTENLFLFPDIQEEEFYGNTDATHLLNWSHTLQLGGLEVGLSYNYRTGHPITPPIGARLRDNGEPEILFASQNSIRLPDYYRMNGSLLYTIDWFRNRNWQTKLGVSVQNFTNRQNLIGQTYTTDQLREESDLTFGDVDIWRQDFFSLPRTFDFLVRFVF